MAPLSRPQRRKERSSDMVREVTCEVLFARVFTRGEEDFKSQMRVYHKGRRKKG